MTVDQPSPTTETNKAKRNLDFSGKEEEAPTQAKNVLNLPYSDSEEEGGQEVDLTKQVVAEYEDFPSPTPREGQEEPMAKTSSRKPRYQRINQLLGKIHEMEVLNREAKRNNAILTKNNAKLHNSLLEMRGMHVLLKRRNLRLMKENTRLYRMIRMMRL